MQRLNFVLGDNFVMKDRILDQNEYGKRYIVLQIKPLHDYYNFIFIQS